MRLHIRCLLIPWVVLCAGGCHKAGPGTDTSPLLFVNASLHDTTVNIYTNGTLLYPALSFPDSTGYLTTASPVKQLTLLSEGDTLLSLPPYFTPGKHYSVFVVDSTSSGGVQVAVMADSLPTLLPGYVSLRFLNFSLSVPNLNLYSASTSQYLFTDRYFDQADSYATSFTSFPAGVYDLELQVPGASVAVATLNGVNLEEGKAYTFFAKGAIGVPGGYGLGIGMVEHN